MYSLDLGINDLLRKVNLTRSLNHMRLLFPDQYDFYPKTWFLPEQMQQFNDDLRYIHQQDSEHGRALTTFIVKPSGRYVTIDSCDDFVCHYFVLCKEIIRHFFFILFIV
jgi:hypothetical protein